MHRTRRFIAVAVIASAVLLLVSPLALYWAGLSGIDGLPRKPSRLASAQQQGLVWKQARGEGTPRIDAMNPYSLALQLLTQAKADSTPDQTIAWWVASDYLVTHRRHRSMGWWHLSGAALTIWLSRHWTSEEILSAAAQRHSASPEPSGALAGDAAQDD